MHINQALPQGSLVAGGQYPSSPCNPTADAPMDIDEGVEDEMSTNSVSHHLSLGNGHILTFTKEEVGDPPAISFSNNIAHLNQIWDDTSRHWIPSHSALYIQGHPIAFVYWRQVYSYGKRGQWKATLNKWADWQVRVL